MTQSHPLTTQEILAQHFRREVSNYTENVSAFVLPSILKADNAVTALLPAAENLRPGAEWKRLSSSQRHERLSSAKQAVNDRIRPRPNPLHIAEIGDLDDAYDEAHRNLESLIDLAANNTPSNVGNTVKQTAKIALGMFFLGGLMVYIVEVLGTLLVLGSFLSLVAVPAFMHHRKTQQADAVEQTVAKIQVAVTRINTLREKIVEIVLKQVSTHVADALAQALPAVENLYLSLPVVGWRWDAPTWQKWAPVTMRPGVTRVGELTYFLWYDAGSSHNGRVVAPIHDRLFRALQAACAPLRLDRPTPSYIIPQETPALTVPWLVSVPGGGNLLIKATGATLNRSMDALQSVMLRLLATVPPGKVRFTLIDPVGLGQNVAAFMRLTDFDEQLVTSRAWSEPRHIEQRLADLSEHIENVIQKYLRNDFATIEEYNAQADEIAEPYRVLVVMGFPVNFTEETAKRLVSIATNGPRCGVSVLVTMDQSKPLPYSFNIADLERVATVVSQAHADPASRHFIWQHPEYRNIGRLQLDPLPPPDLFNRIVQDVGERARAANRVEVPFERITPSPDQWWSGDSRAGIQIPLGRAGANKLQALDLGKGTTHHALVVGRIGSGKSSLFHAAIMNASLIYSPDELELYLIDFKEGVEFKPYASHQLPGARVIAIQSEREFGLSVLQGLSAEYHRRGTLFRSIEVQNIADYRNRTRERLPRILLVIDEFQVLFSEDDGIARESLRLLEELVRLARAAGIHVLLGSQTLGGSSGMGALPEAIKGQMSVRIALQSSETDARLILSEDNPAARLLSRPGEAIYNASNGLVEGNQLFQVAWLPDERRDQYLHEIAAFAQRRQRHSAPPPIVFEGTETADPGRNQTLIDALTAPSWPPSPRAVPLWLGEPIAILPPTTAPLRRQSGSNLLMVGHDAESALGMFIASFISLAAHHAPVTENALPGPRFCVVDLGQVDAPYSGLLKEVASLLPHSTRVDNQRGLIAALDHIANEVHRRMREETVADESLYLLVYGLQRARDLQQDDLFASSPYQDGTPSPAQQFATILREGPDLGVHTVMWCDTLANFERRLGRQAAREFDLRVAFQMGSDESSGFIDTPQASRLGANRALFFSEDLGRLEKFRPYGVPDSGWLSWAGQRLQARASGASPASAPQQQSAPANGAVSPPDLRDQLQRLIDGKR